MSFQSILQDEVNLQLNRLHCAIILSIDDMFSKPIQNGVLNHITLIKGLTHMIIHKDMKNCFYFTELTVNNLVKYLHNYVLHNLTNTLICFLINFYIELKEH